MKCKRLLQTSLLTFFMIFYASGQERLMFRQLGTIDGLSNGSIKSIIQDSDGFMWFGTIDGLNKYDGIRFKVYNYSKNKPGCLSADDVSCILEDSQGMMWVGTFGGGLNLYDKDQDNFKAFTTNSRSNHAISSNEINVLYEDSQKQLWIGTENGLCKYSPSDNSFTTHTHVVQNPYSLSSKSVRAIYEDKKGYLWIGTFGGGLNKFDVKTGKFTHYKLDAQNKYSISSDFVLDIEPCGKYLLIGTNGGGLELFDPQTGYFENFFHKYTKAHQDIQIVKDIYTDSNGTIWVGTDGEGLFRIQVKEEEGIYKFNVKGYLYSSRVKSSLGSNAIYKIYEDNQQNIWIGTAWNGISVIEHPRGNVDFYYSDIEGVDPSPVLSVYVDAGNNLWIGSDGKGLYFHNKETGEIINYSDSETGSPDLDYIQVILQDKKDNFWIGTYANGLIYFNPKTRKFHSYKNDPANPVSISHNNVRSIIEDVNGNLWVSTWGGGISYFNTSTRKFTNYLHNENNPVSISNNNVLALEQAGNDKLWVGTFGGGLNLFDIKNGSATKFISQKDNINSLSGNNILCLHLDKNENLWIGTWGAGLTKFDIINQEFTRYDQESGLINNTITAIEEDDDGVLWLSTKKGICSLNPRTNEIKVLNMSKKSRVSEFHINSSYCDTKGNLYFGGIEGFICFNPDKLSGNNLPLNVRFTDFELFNKPVVTGKNSPLKKQITYSDQIVLNHKQSVFTLKFAALDYPFSENCRYAVKMEGFEENWREIGTQTTATYTNLSPGKYIFKVKAKPLNAGWKDQYTAINIIVKPPLMKTWWAFGIYVLLFIGLLYAFQRYTFTWARLKNNLKLERVKREQESNIHQLKLRFFTNISHELRTPLTLILDPLNSLIESGQGGSTIQRPLKIIKKNTDRLMQLINELLDFRKMELGKLSLKVAEGNIVKFTKEIFLSFREYARNHNIRYTFSSSEEKLILWYDRYHMEKVIYNLLSNAFKFTSEKGKITIKVISEGEHVKIIVEDNGEGIPEKQIPFVFERFYHTDRSTDEQHSGFGIGLSMVKELVKMHGGEITVSSVLGGGSTFTIILPQGKDHFSEESLIKNYKSSEQIESYKSGVVTDEQAGKKIRENLQNKGQSILIVEDNDDLRSYLCEHMGPLFNVVEASNGREGIEKAFEMIPDIIISDVMMPVTDGIELCRKLKSDMRTSHIPVILLTARTASIYKLEGYETGADDYLTKPFRMDELLSRIKNLLNNRKLLRERYMKEMILQPKEVIITSPDEKFLTNLIEVLENHIDQPEFKMELLSKELGMSHSVIYKKLKALTGQSLVEFVRDLRLKRAAQMLSQNKLSVTEICYQVGFTDRRYFSQVFKKKYGMTPSEYAEKGEDK